MVKVMHYLHHRPSFGLGNKPQHEQAAGDGVSYENQEAELAEAVLGGETQDQRVLEESSSDKLVHC